MTVMPQFCLVLFPISEFSVVRNIFETEQLQIGNCVDTRQLLVSTSVHTVNTDKTRQDKTSFVLSVSAV